MDIVRNPKRSDWPELIKRPQYNPAKLFESVREIFSRVKADGDLALTDYTIQFDGIKPMYMRIPVSEITHSGNHLSKELKDAISVAKRNIEKFHQAQQDSVQKVEIQPGVYCWRKSVAIDTVGLYVPGGTAPLFSSLLMLGVPAKLAGCRKKVICTPPNGDGRVDDIILFTANLIGLKNIYCVGGAQAIAAMTFGTDTIPKVDKIFGPGNQYVTAAKQLSTLEGTAIDMPAGPSEVAVIADDTANPEFVASDLLSQAEHGPDSQVLLLTDSETLLDRVLQALDEQIVQLPRRKIAEKSLESGKAILLDSIKTAMDLSNLYAPEHLILATRDASELAGSVVCAGSVFIGNYSCESAGDYASGTNHTLPTNGFARNYSGISMDSFYKKITFQEISASGLKSLGPVIELMAEAESLHAHANAVKVRRKNLEALDVK